MNNNWTTRNNRTSRRGLFVDGVWWCACKPRLAADKLQVKNGDRNHGRWFYICRKAQPRRCQFFLWADDAKTREKVVVSNESRSDAAASDMQKPIQEQGQQDKRDKTEGSRDSPYEEELNQAPRTPTRRAHGMQQPTPQTGRRDPARGSMRNDPRSQTMGNRGVAATSASGSNTEGGDNCEDGQSDQEAFGWSSSADDELIGIAEEASRGKKDNNQSSPRETTRTLDFSSPGKRKVYGVENDAVESETVESQTTLGRGNDVFFTPSSSSESRSGSTVGDSWFPLDTPNRTDRMSYQGKRSISPEEICHPALGPPKRIVQQSFGSPPQYEQQTADKPPTLASGHLVEEVLSVLKTVTLPSQVEQGLVHLLNQHELRTNGVAKGREITRLAVKAKDKRITELEVQVAQLEIERETSNTEITQLKHDLATWSKTSRRPKFAEELAAGAEPQRATPN